MPSLGAVAIFGASMVAGTDKFCASAVAATALVSVSLGELSKSAQPEATKTHPAISKLNLFTSCLLSFTNRILISKPGAVLQMD